MQQEELFFAICHCVLCLDYFSSNLRSKPTASRFLGKNDNAKTQRGQRRKVENVFPSSLRLCPLCVFLETSTLQYMEPTVDRGLVLVFEDVESDAFDISLRMPFDRVRHTQCP